MKTIFHYITRVLLTGLSVRLKVEKELAFHPLERHKDESSTATKESEPAPLAGKIPVRPLNAQDVESSSSKGPSFTIFNDFEPEAARLPKQRPADTRGVVKPALIPQVALESKSEAGNRTAEAFEINDLLNDIGILDAGDGTINTRLARRDIDSMFFSPEKEDEDYAESAHSPLRPMQYKHRGLSNLAELSDIHEVIFLLWNLKNESWLQ